MRPEAAPFPGNRRVRETNRDSLTAHLEELLSKNRGLILAASERTTRLLRKETADPYEFSDIMSGAEIAADLQRTNEARAKFNEHSKEEDLLDRLALSTEFLLYHQIGIAGWLSAEGVRTYVEKTADPDDVLRGTDIVIEFDMGQGMEPLAISVDLTIGSLTLSKKVHSIKQGIDTGTLSEVRYHTEPDGNHKSLLRTPKVAIGISPDRAMALTKLFMSENKEATAKLRDHPIQLAITRQVYLQLEGYEDYAAATDKPKLAERFARAKAAIKKVLAEKEAKFKDDPLAMGEDSVSDMRLALRSQLSRPNTEDRPYQGNVGVTRKYH